MTKDEDSFCRFKKSVDNKGECCCNEFKCCLSYSLRRLLKRLFCYGERDLSGGRDWNCVCLSVIGLLKQAEAK